MNLDICTIDPKALAARSQRRARIAATLKGDFVIRRESPWIVDANGNALKLLALGAWHGLIRPSGRVRSDPHQVRKTLKAFNHKYICIPSKFCVASSSTEGKTSKSILIKPRFARSYRRGDASLLLLLLDNFLEGVMLSDLDILLTAHLMMHEHGGEAELEAATQADRMLRRGDRNELLTWFRIWRTIAVMRQVPTGLPT